MEADQKKTNLNIKKRQFIKLNVLIKKQVTTLKNKYILYIYITPTPPHPYLLRTIAGQSELYPTTTQPCFINSSSPAFIISQFPH